MDDYTNETIIRKAKEIVIELQEEYIHYADGDNEAALEWLAKAAAISFAYHYGSREYDNQKVFANEWLNIYNETDVNSFMDNIERVLWGFEWYSYDYNDIKLWTLVSYLWHNEIGGEYAMSIYERDCLDDPYYQEMGRTIKNVLTDR